jgi:hypothetical protein
MREEKGVVTVVATGIGVMAKIIQELVKALSNVGPP